MGSRVDASVRVKESLHVVKDWPPASYRLAGIIVLCCLCPSSAGDGRATATFGTSPMEAGGNKRASSSPVKRGVR
jgi:hypothetical protein